LHNPEAARLHFLTPGRGCFYVFGVNMKFVAEERKLQGTGASRRLRRAEKVPGIVYGAGEPTMIELAHKDLFFALKKEAFHSSLLEMDLDGKVEQVILRDYQMHPVKQLVLHVDFQRVDQTDACLVNHVVTELKVQCLASQLPEFVTIDLSQLTKGQSLHVNDLKLPEGVKVMTQGQKNPVIVSVTVNKVVEDEAANPDAAVLAAPAAKTKAKKDEKQNRK
jgi:large subunit ribosomal protein L25